MIGEIAAAQRNSGFVRARAAVYPPYPVVPTTPTFVVSKFSLVDKSLKNNNDVLRWNDSKLLVCWDSVIGVLVYCSSIQCTST